MEAGRIPFGDRAGGPADPSRQGVSAEGAHPLRDDSRWSLDEAVALCREIEAICPGYGCHVALTGGTLYKDGRRKDCDLLFYRIRQSPQIDEDGLFAALALIGVTKTGGYGWCHKAEYRGKAIDCFFPEEDGEYPTEEEVDFTPEDVAWALSDSAIEARSGETLAARSEGRKRRFREAEIAQNIPDQLPDSNEPTPSLYTQGCNCNPVPVLDSSLHEAAHRIERR